MLNDISRLLDENFSVVEENKTIENNIYRDGNANQETFVELTYYKKENSYVVYLHQRDNKIEKYRMESCDKAINVAVLFSKSLLEVRNFDSSIQKLILNTKSIKEIETIFYDNDSINNCFSFFERKSGKINIEKNKHSNYNIYYFDGENKSYIVEDREMNNACLVLYNFSFKLNCGKNIIKKLDKSSTEEYDLEKIYLSLT